MSCCLTASTRLCHGKCMHANGSGGLIVCLFTLIQCGSLPIALAARGHRVMVVSPGYSDFGDQLSDVSAVIPQHAVALCF